MKEVTRPSGYNGCFGGYGSFEDFRRGDEIAEILLQKPKESQ